MHLGARAVPAFIVAAAFLLASSSLGHGTTASARQVPAAAVAAAPAAAGVPAGKPGFDLGRLDRTCPACRDFYQFATGGWQKKHPIPPEYPSWNAFAVVQERNVAVLHGLLDRAAADTSAPADGNQRRLGTYYRSCMAQGAIEAAGTGPLEAELGKLSAVADVPGLVAEIAHLAQGVAPGTPFDFASSQDPHNSAATIADIGQDGLSLPERDYYVDASPHAKALRDEFTAHVARTFALLGDDATTAKTEAAAVVGLETKLAVASFTNVQLRDVKATTNAFTLTSLEMLAPNLQWPTFAQALNASQTNDLNVDEPSFIKAVDAMLASEPLADWKAYLRWRIVDQAAPALPKAFVDERFSFTKTLYGTQKQQPRWKRCVQATGNAMSEALGELYVKNAFSPAAKARALAMVDNIGAALRDDLTTLPWMSPQTRSVALQKIDAMRKKIAYPDRFRDYSALIVQDDSYLANRYRAGQFAWNYDVAKIGKPTNRAEWGFPPQTVNAQYDPPNNDITFPAGILQSPFYDVGNDDALNYGAIGAVIGHEMTHGFDDQGRQYDPSGNQRDWWTSGDVARFNARARCVSAVYDKLPVDATLNQKGDLVLGEAIADLGGTTIAFRAFERAQAGKAKTKIQGFTPEQRFFLGYANVWAENSRPEAARVQGKTDVHALARNRVMGTLENMPQFAKAWTCPLRSKMVRPATQRCSIW